MVLDLCHGSVAIFAVRHPDGFLRSGQQRDIPGVPLMVLDSYLGRNPAIALTIDGVDEVDPYLNLIMGADGAPLCKKSVAQVSHCETIVVHESKLSPALASAD